MRSTLALLLLSSSLCALPQTPLWELNAGAAGPGRALGSSAARQAHLVALGDPAHGSGAGRVLLFDSRSRAVLFGLDAPTPTPQEGYGASLALSPTHVAGGAPLAAGVELVHVHALADGAHAFSVNSPGALADSDFGAALAFSGAELLVGEPRAHSVAPGAGAVHRYALPGGAFLGSWTPAGGAAAAQRGYGSALARSAGRVLVGGSDPHAQSDGVERVWVHDAETGELLDELVASDGALHVGFGSALAVDGSLAAVGAPTATNDFGLRTGAVDVYDLASSSFVRRLAPNNLSDSSRFGSSVALDGGRLWVGAPAWQGAPAGSGRVFVYDVASGALMHELAAPPLAPLEQFGARLVVDSGGLLVTATDFATSGQAWVTRPTLSSFPATLSATSGGNVILDLVDGPWSAGGTRLVLGSASGTLPGIPVAPGVVLPLQPDAYLLASLSSAGSFPFLAGFAPLGANGTGTAEFFFPPGLPQGLILHHAGLVFDATGGVLGVSEPQPLQFVP